MERVQSYGLISESKKEEFERLINQFLECGWTLYGSPFADQEGKYCQAIVVGWETSEQD